MLRRLLIAVAMLIWAAGHAPASVINNQMNLAWKAVHNVSGFLFDLQVTANRAAGYRMTDLDAYPTSSGGILFSQIWERNIGNRPWVVARNLTSSEFGSRWNQLAAQGYRLADFESYLQSNVQRYAGIWVKNTEGWSWSSKRDMTKAQYATYFNQQRNLGRRPIDIEVYRTASGLRYAAIWYQNVNNVAWVQLRDMSRATYQQQLNAKTAAGYRVIDFEAYAPGSVPSYAVIWEKKPPGRSWLVRSDMTEITFNNNSRKFKDQGYRLVDFERYQRLDGFGREVVAYGGLWVENDSRFDYSRKIDLHNKIKEYLQGASNLPGLSVAIIRNGTVIYREGFGYADRNAGRVAHGETIYSAASVSKVIAGTLAAKLEAEDRLRDGTTFDLDLTLKTYDYIKFVQDGFVLDWMPPHHRTQKVEQLLAHLGCVAHYETTPDIDDQPGHYATATDAMRQIWDTPLVTKTAGDKPTSCTIGTTHSYSTPALNFVGAVLEKVTGRPISQLIKEEIAAPYGLSTLRVQFETASLPSVYNRASPYENDNDETTYRDTSWKVLGGGLELSPVDLATFGWKVLSEQIVSHAAQTRLWTRVSPSSYGLGWYLEGTGMASHSGSQLGSATFIRVYRDKGLVIAIMSNRQKQVPKDEGGLGKLSANLGSIVLN